MFAISYYNTITKNLEMTYGFESIQEALYFTTTHPDDYISQDIFVWDDTAEDFIFVRKAFTQTYHCAPQNIKISNKEI